MSRPRPTDRVPAGRGGRAWLALAVGIGLVLPTGPLVAQELSGVALDPEGGPLADVPVVLHRVGTGGGALVGTDTTGPAGEFRFQLPARDSSVYFAALRYEGSLYIGPATRAGEEPLTGYLLQVGPDAEVGAVATALADPGAPPPATARPVPAQSTDAGAIWLVTVLAVSAAAVFLYTAPRYRRRRTREALVEVAGIENELDTVELSAGERRRLEERRDRLKEQLAPRD